ncbi:GcrA cell cycle regulator [Bradyrhizobium lablabi]|uniref:GcrA cell cycle regulator n=1 Tax=Bradyrhizobium lablabi TaxID=722472 RepID=A0A1M6LL13_9BRAD|nr:GcrA family cell cycle regulator [Bradyrhizobium lablabi]SHJ71850.1 GcrA cell cycle regulator [Bradyrhizobium lablabi]
MRWVETWSQEQRDLLKTKWEAGVTAQAIADELGISRNAVCGKIDRLKLSRSVKPPPTESELQARKDRIREKNTERMRKRRGSVAFKPKPIPREIPMQCLEPLNLALADLTMKDGRPVECRFITNDDLTDARYCGHAVDSETSWCPHHRLKLQPPRGWIAPAMAPKIAVAA